VLARSCTLLPGRAVRRAATPSPLLIAKLELRSKIPRSCGWIRRLAKRPIPREPDRAMLPANLGICSSPVMSAAAPVSWEGKAVEWVAVQFLVPLSSPRSSTSGARIILVRDLIGDAVTHQCRARSVVKGSGKWPRGGKQTFFLKFN
jgi:hypothetical protein